MQRQSSLLRLVSVRVKCALKVCLPDEKLYNLLIQVKIAFRTLTDTMLCFFLLKTKN